MAIPDVRRIVRWNRGLVVAIGVLGFVNDEPYLRELGHSPDLPDYAFWFGLLLNGPSGFLADFVSFHASRNGEARSLIQHALWVALVGPQWRLYAAAWARGRMTRDVVASVLLLAGSVGAVAGWLHQQRPSEGFVDRYFWLVRFAGVAAAGAILLAVPLYSKYCANRPS